jgi:hypothetical protein
VRHRRRADLAFDGGLLEVAERDVAPHVAILSQTQTNRTTRRRERHQTYEIRRRSDRRRGRRHKEEGEERGADHADQNGVESRNGVEKFRNKIVRLREARERERERERERGKRR